MEPLGPRGNPVKAASGWRLGEQGEADGMFTVEDSCARCQDLIKTGTVVPILQNKPDMPGLPLLRDVLPKDKGPLLNWSFR